MLDPALGALLSLWLPPPGSPCLGSPSGPFTLPPLYLLGLVLVSLGTMLSLSGMITDLGL